MAEIRADKRAAASTTAVPDHRATLLFATIVATSLGGLVVAMRFPAEEAGFTYSTVAAAPQALWRFLLAAGVNLVVGVTALAAAGMSLARQRGAVWATVGGAIMWLGAGLYAVGLGNWAGMFVAATHPTALDERSSEALVETLNADALLMWMAPGGGAAAVAIGTVLLAVGLWRARTIPRWVPLVAAVSIVASFLVPTSGLVGLLVEGPSAIASVAIGAYAWQRSRTDGPDTPAVS